MQRKILLLCRIQLRIPVYNQIWGSLAYLPTKSSLSIVSLYLKKIIYFFQVRTQIFCTVNACSISVKSLKVLALSPFFLIYLFVVTNSRWGLTLSIFFVVSEQKTFISQKLHQPNKRFFFFSKYSTNLLHMCPIYLNDADKHL